MKEIQNSKSGKQIKLSIIICVYNTNPSFLKECLQSIFDSTLRLEKFQVILIDDGSSMDYSDLLNKYPVEYFKIENAGPFAARLYGVSLAKGEYLAFLDSDDCVSLNYHLPMLQKAEQTNADIVINGWAFWTDRTMRVCYTDTTMASEIDAEGHEPLVLFSAQQGKEHSYFVNWNKIYRRDLIAKTIEALKQEGLCGQRIEFGEDALFNFFNFKYANKVVNLHSGFYLYRIHNNQVSKEKTQNQLKNHIRWMSFIFDTMCKNIGNHPEREKIADNIGKWRTFIARSQYQVALTQKHPELFPLIEQAYGVAKPDLIKREDSPVYAKTELLGENFAYIDKMLTQYYFMQSPALIRCEKNCRWISRTVKTAASANKDEKADFSPIELVIPKRVISLRDRLMHHPIVIKIGMKVFKKGSRIRAYLKKTV